MSEAFSRFVAMSLGTALALAPLSAMAAQKKAKHAKGKAAAQATKKEVEAPTEAAAEAPQSLADTTPWNMFKWQKGPTTGKLAEVAHVNVPAGYLFADKDEAQKIMTALENPVDGSELGLIMVDRREDSWMALFEYEDSGHINDDDKDELKPDDILKSIKEGNEAANEERKSRGWAELTITGWSEPPHYNEQTKHLEWAISATSEGHPVVNYNTRLLGRTGVMSVVLLVAPDKLKAALPDYQKLVAAYSYVDGNRYGDYRQGDKLAEYGLAALMVGGGAAIAAKTGFLMQFLLLFKKAWKLLIVGLVAAAAGLKKFVGRLFGGGSDKAPPLTQQVPPRDELPPQA